MVLIIANAAYFSGVGCPLERRRSVVLDACNVSSVGEGLEGLCPLVEELHLSSNQLSDWSNVSLLCCTACVCVGVGGYRCDMAILCSSQDY